MKRNRFDFQEEDLPKQAERKGGWGIKRAPEKGDLRICVVSKKWLGMRTHWWKGRTTPCLKYGCEACKAGHVSRWNGYLLAVINGTGQRIVLEFTPHALEHILVIWEKFHNLRGHKFSVKREKAVANGKVAAVHMGQTDKLDLLPKDEDVWEIMAYIWGLNSDRIPIGEVSNGDEKTEHEQAREDEEESGSTGSGVPRPRPRPKGSEGNSEVLPFVQEVADSSGNTERFNY